MHARPPPTCPRCGYDQSDAVKTWTDRCPLTGVCTECGAELEWSEVCRVHPGTLWWYAEHAPNRRALLWRTPLTLLMLIDPRRFWARVCGDLDRSTVKLVWFIAVTFVYAHLAVSVLVWIARASSHSHFTVTTMHNLEHPSAHTLAALLYDAVSALIAPFMHLYGSVYSPSLSFSSLLENSYVIPLIVGVVLYSSVVWSVVLAGARALEGENRGTNGQLRRSITLSVAGIAVLTEILRALLFIGAHYYTVNETLWFPAIWILVPFSALIWNQLYWCSFAARCLRLEMKIQVMIVGIVVSIGAPLAVSIMMFF